MKIPAQITSGDSATWKDDIFVSSTGQILDSSAYTLVYLFRGPSTLDLTAVADGRGWITTLAKNSLLVPGEHSVTARLTSDSERLTVGVGRISVLTDLTQLNAGGEYRSSAEIQLAQVDAAIKGSRVESYKIGSREAKKYSIAELMLIRNLLMSQVKNERASRDIANGLGNPSNLMVRFR